MKTTLKKGSVILLLLTLLIAVTFCFASCEKDEEGTHEHQFEETVVPPSCTDGYTLHVCSICGYSYTDRYTEGNGHSFTDEKVDAAHGKARDDAHGAAAPAVFLHVEDLFVPQGFLGDGDRNGVVKRAQQHQPLGRDGMIESEKLVHKSAPHNRRWETYPIIITQNL